MERTLERAPQERAPWLSQGEPAQQAEHRRNLITCEGLQRSRWVDTGSQQSCIPQVFIDLAAR